MSKFIFISAAAFKARIKATKCDVVISPKTQKYFVSTDQGNYKCEDKIDLTQELQWMYESEEKFSDGCLVSTPQGQNVMHSF